MNWKLILRIVAIVSLLAVIAGFLGGCKSPAEDVIDWEDCSQKLGEHPCNFTLLDQDGNDFNLYDHLGKVIILDFSTMWCGPCQMVALEVEELQQKYKDDIVYVTILIENTNHRPPTKADVKRWAESFGITSAPVLGGSRDLLSSDPDLGWPLAAWPQFYIISRDMVIVDSFKGFSLGNMERVIKENVESDTGSP